MSKLSAKELVEKVTALLPDITTDDALTLFEDINDSVPVETEDWKQKYEDNDKAWRKRYSDRFMGVGDNQEPDPDSDPETKPDSELTYENLFK